MDGSVVKHSLMGLNLHFSMKYQPFQATISRRRRCCLNGGDFRSKSSQRRSCQSERRSVCYRGFTERPRCAHQPFVWILACRLVFFCFFSAKTRFDWRTGALEFLIDAERESRTTVPSFQSGSFATARAVTPSNQLGTTEGRQDVRFPVL